MCKFKCHIQTQAAIPGILEQNVRYFEHLFFNCVNVKDIWIYVYDELQKTTNTHFVQDLRSCILGVYDENCDSLKIINTVMLLVKMYTVKPVYKDRSRNKKNEVFIDRWSL